VRDLGLVAAIALAATACGVKGPPRPFGAPERPAAPTPTVSPTPTPTPEPRP